MGKDKGLEDNRKGDKGIIGQKNEGQRTEEQWRMGAKDKGYGSRRKL